jgi:hypothetical protein
LCTFFFDRFSHLPEDGYSTRTSPIATKGKRTTEKNNNI